MCKAHIGLMCSALVLTASVVGLTGIAAAQTAAQVSATSGGTLGEVIVTARKFEENLQDTPIAVTAFTGTELEQRQIFKTDRLDEVVPNLQFANNAPLAGNNASSQVFIRGIGQTDPTSTVDPGVGLYIDDVYIGNAVGGSHGAAGIASVQVLRGPQGTLFGRNTIGGAIVLTTDGSRRRFRRHGASRPRLGQPDRGFGAWTYHSPTHSSRASPRASQAGRLRDANGWHRPRRHQHLHGAWRSLSGHRARKCRGRLPRSITPTRMRTAVRSCSPRSTSRQRFARVASPDAGCPGS